MERVSSLSGDDRKWFDEVWVVRERKLNKVEGMPKSGDIQNIAKHEKMDSVVPIGFKEVPAAMANRLNIPPIDQGEVYDEDYGTTGSALTPFIYWWHHSKVLEVPSRRDDDERRIEWLFKNLNKISGADEINS